MLLVLWLTALTLQSFATAQEADVVYVDGIAYALLARPIVQNETLFQSLQGLVDKEKVPEPLIGTVLKVIGR